jgi:hypothetical protein
MDHLNPKAGAFSRHVLEHHHAGEALFLELAGSATHAPARVRCIPIRRLDAAGLARDLLLVETETPAWPESPDQLEWVLLPRVPTAATDPSLPAPVQVTIWKGRSEPVAEKDLEPFGWGALVT